MQRVDGIALSCAQFVVVIVLSAVGALVFGEHTTLAAVKTCLPFLLYVGVMSSGVGYTLQILAQKDGAVESTAQLVKDTFNDKFGA